MLKFKVVGRPIPGTKRSLARQLFSAMQSYSEHLLSSSIARRDAAEEREEQGAAYGNNNMMENVGLCLRACSFFWLFLLQSITAAPATPHKPIAVPEKAFAQPHLKGGNFQ